MGARFFYLDGLDVLVYIGFRLTFKVLKNRWDFFPFPGFPEISSPTFGIAGNRHCYTQGINAPYMPIWAYMMI
jgi:hypothetical protein